MSFFSNGLEVGLFQLPFMGGFGVILVFWSILLIIAGVQLLLCRSRRKWLRYSLLTLSSVFFVFCAIMCEVITGWDMLGWLILGGAALTLMLGCGLGFLINRFIKKDKSNEV